MELELNPLRILERLVSFRSIVGRSNLDIVEWVREFANSHGADVSIVPGPEGDRANLFISIGPRNVPGIVLSGHLDVVPAVEAGWEGDPFILRRKGERLYGRGTVDMKGFVACALAALANLRSKRLTRPVHIALSYDEEAGCKGVPHLIAKLPRLCAPPESVIVGEPTGLVPVLAHKGKVAARAVVRGKAGHSSRPDLGLNAIHAILPVLDTAVKEAQNLIKGPHDPNFEPPYSTLQIGTIRGGEAINIVPENCILEMEARAMFGVLPKRLLDPVEAALDRLRSEGFETSWEIVSSYPALRLDASTPLATQLAGLTGKRPLPAVSFGTEAGLFQEAGLDAIVCGPGEIGRAHRPNEYITLPELENCLVLIEAIGERLSE
ncbi:acetylornithine deacetylase [Hoeflea prorocentri]|uniref:Acetylornithine deacetylase n=1 Tax=Hoeflea prorocentri TaxID=1922333 RepID=A0A9X3UER9_9HYPH|nr:acetylornithine deacetylase [Hoeflea prorocentri]MCY6379375.1 acetylornithine deacetylase [Hoeflea prorocentri]MDA5397176.1 acetylornithine deacetylase [Hoeflea prorocentri]